MENKVLNQPEYCIPCHQNTSPSKKKKSPNKVRKDRKTSKQLGKASLLFKDRRDNFLLKGNKISRKIQDHPSKILEVLESNPNNLKSNNLLKTLKTNSLLKTRSLLLLSLTSHQRKNLTKDSTCSTEEGKTRPKDLCK